MRDPGGRAIDVRVLRRRGLASSVAVLAMLFTASAAQADHSAEESANAAAFERFAQAYNSQTDDWFAAYHNPDYIWQGYGVWAPSGRRLVYDEMLTLIDDEVRHFPDRRMQIHRLLADGSQLAVDYEWTGTAADGVPGIEPGTVMRWRNLLFLRFRDGKMSRATEYGVKPPDPVAPSP